MAYCASFDFRFVLVNERALFFRVALVANFVSCHICPQLSRTKRAVRTVTIVALDQTLVHSVMERPRKLCTNVHVALVTEVRRPFPHQKLAFLGVMGRMAVHTTDTTCQVYRPVVIPLLLGVLMTA
jgi:hypothetical protein